MKNTFLVVILGLMLIGCAGTNPHNQSPIKPDTKPNVDITQFENVHLCEHKYSDDLDFYYHGRLVAKQKELFGEMVFILTYTLLDDTKKYLSGDEVQNYECYPVNFINNE